MAKQRSPSQSLRNWINYADQRLEREGDLSKSDLEDTLRYIF